MNEQNDYSSVLESRPQPLRWGILGAARIARKAVASAILAQGGTIETIGASTLDRATAFAGEFAIPKAVEGYEAVLADDNIEAVYIPLANGLHFRWALECARAGKHCLCEKPLVLTADEASQLREAFTQAGCRLMEAFMWRHHPQTDWIALQIQNKELGTLRRIHAEFSFMLDRPDDFRWRDEQGGGALWDIGVYCVNAMRLFFGEEPLAVSARAVPAQPGARTDRSSAGWLDFGDDRLATFACSFNSAYTQTLTLLGTEGQMVLERPFSGLALASSATVHSGGKTIEHAFEPDNAYLGMIAHFTRAARDPSFALEPGEDGLHQAQAMEALAQSAASGGSPQTVEPY